MQLNILKDDYQAGKTISLPRRKLATLAEIIGRRESVRESAEVNLIVTGDERVRALNKRYRQLDKTTDVLSFSPGSGEPSELIGEIYISAPRAREQAAEFQHSVTAEILRLTCHGLFHLLGYDHDTDEAAERMEALECEALKALAAQRTLSNKRGHSQS